MEERNKTVIQNFYEEFFNGHIVESADKYVREDYIQHNPGVEQGREALGIVPLALHIARGDDDF